MPWVLITDKLASYGAPQHHTVLRSVEHRHVDTEHGSVDHVRLDVGCHDPVTQRLDESHVVLVP